MTNPTDLPAFSASFLQEFIDHHPPPPASHSHRRRGRPALLPARDIVAALAWHVMQPTATFARNLAALTGQDLADSTLSERRQALGIKPWMDTLGWMLRPLAHRRLHPQAFYKGLCLKGTDGTTFNVANTPAIKRGTAKTAARRGRAAFHRISCAVLVELGTHNPVGVRVAQNKESEAVLAGQLIHELNETDLLIADRYYGSGRWAARLLALPAHPWFLLRVQERFRAVRLRRLPDGSCIVKVNDPDTGQSITLRQIKGSVRRRGRRWVKVRFWTNLLDHKRYPAHELLALYAMRWEQEIAYRELKHYLQDDNLLLSHTVVTAIQEICALCIAQAVVARARAKTAANHDIPLMQISFAKTLLACRNFGWLLSVAGDILTRSQVRQIAAEIERRIAQQRSPPRRKRSCPRMVRQPINKWHRLMRNHYSEGPCIYTVRES